jgi:protein-L-isoaspartate(D-aspartate) O-methyltransferase
VAAHPLPQAYVDEADLDRPIPIGSGQVTTQPSLVAAMLEALALHDGERVLEVGTGHGYQAGILGRLAHKVWTVERLPEFAAAAAANRAAEGACAREGEGGEGAADRGGDVDAAPGRRRIPLGPTPAAPRL